MGILQARRLEWVARPSSGCLPDTGIEPESLMSPALAGGFSTTSTTCEALRGDEKHLEYTQGGTWNDLVEPHACCSKHPCPSGQPVQDLRAPLLEESGEGYLVSSTSP